MDAGGPECGCDCDCDDHDLVPGHVGKSSEPQNLYTVCKVYLVSGGHSGISPD